MNGHNLLIFRHDNNDIVIPLFWCDLNCTDVLFFRELPFEYQEKINFLFSEDQIIPEDGIYEVWHKLNMLDII